MRYEHIVWDYDGTLVDSYPIFTEAFQQILLGHGVHVEVDALLAHMKDEMPKTIAYYKAQCGLTDYSIDMYQALRLRLEHEKLELMKGAREVCKYVRTHGGHNYIVTHNDNRVLDFLAKMDMAQYFSDIITSVDGFHRKPCPDSILYLLNRHKINKESALMIGDRELDIQTANNSGIYSCFFTEQNKNKSSIDADHFINEISELIEILKTSEGTH